MRKGLILLAIFALAAFAPTTASAFSMGPAWRQVPWTSEERYFLGAGAGFASQDFKVEGEGFSDQTQTRYRAYGEAGKVLKDSSSEIFLRVGISHLQIRDAFNVGGKADLEGNAPYYAIGGRIRFQRQNDRFEDESEAPAHDQRFRAGAFFLASWDGRVAAAETLDTSRGRQFIEIESEGMYTGTVGLSLETLLGGGWRAYAVPAASFSWTRQKGRNLTTGELASATCTTKMPAGAILGVRYTGSVLKALEIGGAPGFTFGFEAGWVGGPTATAYVSQLY